LKQERGLMASFLFHRAMVRTLGEGSTKSAENEVNKADFGITAKGRNLEGKGRAPRGLCPIPLPPSLPHRKRVSFTHIKKTTGLYRTPIKKNRFTVWRLPKTPGKSGISRGSCRQSRGFPGTGSRASRGSRGFSTSALPARCRRRAFPSRIRAEASCTPA